MNIETNGPNLIIGDTIMDLTLYQGRKVTVFQEKDGSLTIESKPTHWLTICELEVPEPEITADPAAKEGDKGETGEIKQVVKPLVLKNESIRVFKEVSHAA